MLPAILPAILRAMLNMFNFPAILLAIFIYLEGDFDYDLAKTELKGHPHLAILPAIFVPFELGCSRRGYCWQLIARNIPSTSSNIAGKIKGLKISFCLILMPNFKCEEVNLSFNFLYCFLNMIQMHEPTFSVTNINLL